MSFKLFSDKQTQSSAAKSAEGQKEAANANPKAVASDKPSAAPATDKKS